MLPIITEITFYIIVALLLGYLFGWLTSKALIEERLERKLQNSNSKALDEIQQELNRYKMSNDTLLSENNRVLRQNSEKKLQLHELKNRLDKLNLLVKSKNSAIEELTSELSNREKNLLELKKEHASEINAFVYERSDIMKRYKTLLEKRDSTDS